MWKQLAWCGHRLPVSCGLLLTLPEERVQAAVPLRRRRAQGLTCALGAGVQGSVLVIKSIGKVPSHHQPLLPCALALLGWKMPGSRWRGSPRPAWQPRQRCQADAPGKCFRQQDEGSPPRATVLAGTTAWEAGVRTPGFPPTHPALAPVFSRAAKCSAGQGEGAQVLCLGFPSSKLGSLPHVPEAAPTTCTLGSTSEPL